MADVSAEAWFLLLCMREPDVAPTAALRAAADAVRDWDAAVTQAERHRAAAYVAEAARRANLTLPDEAATRLHQTSLAALARCMALDAELRRLGAALADAQISAIVLKGPALARTLYPTAALRPYGDLDLTVRPTHQAAAVALLETSGFQEIPYEAEEARRAHLAHDGAGGEFHRLFVRPSSRALVELHLDPLQLGLRPRCEAGRWRRALPLPSLSSVLMLSPEDQLVQLSVHAHKHGWERLIWLKDIDLLLRTHSPTLDWRLVVDVARREGGAASVWYTMFLARRLLATPVPRAALTQSRPSPPVRALYRAVWPVARIAGLDAHMRRRAVQFHAAESWRGTLPSLVLMGRRRDRLREIIRGLL